MEGRAGSKDLDTVLFGIPLLGPWNVRRISLPHQSGVALPRRPANPEHIQWAHTMGTYQS